MGLKQSYYDANFSKLTYFTDKDKLTVVNMLNNAPRDFIAHFFTYNLAVDITTIK